MRDVTVRLAALWVASLVLALAACEQGAPARPRKIYVSAHDVSKLNVLDGDTLTLLTSIDIGSRRMPHDVVATAAGDRVLLTVATLDGVDPDEVMVFDPATDSVVATVALDPAAFIDTIVVSPDGTQAFVSGWGSNRIYRIDLATLTRLPDFVMTGIPSPLGIRLTADGTLLYTANGSASVSEIDARSGGQLREFLLPGAAVAIAVASTAVYATVFHPPAVARIDRASGAVTVFDLPDARGMGKLALSADERTLYAPDEGERTIPGNQLFVLDADTGAVLARHQVGLGGNAVALSPDGRLAYVTGMFDGSLAVVDLATGVVTMATTDRGPNSVALWWGMP